MKKFMDKDFLLKTKTAQILYHDYAAKMPIIDYHCHVNPKEIAEDRQFSSITQAWLGGDHYKWRGIRTNGVSEKYITGDSTDYEKFEQWAKTLQGAIGNPLYHWTHLELKTYFDIDEPLTPKNAKEIFDKCNKKLAKKDMSVKGIIKKSNVKLICTTDDPVDSLQWHEKINSDTAFGVKVLPTFRPDKGINIDKDGFIPYIQNLGKLCNINIQGIKDLLNAFTMRLDYFDKAGCLASDHGLDYVPFESCTDMEADTFLKTALSGIKLDMELVDKFKTYLLLFFGREYAKRNWVMQLHYGAQRNNNSDMFKKLGPDTGFDSISNKPCSLELSKLLDALNKENNLPKTIIYSLNPYDNEVIASLIGCFMSDEIKGKIQHGSAWWFNDTKTGMQNQLLNLANLSLLSNFIGMLTDSRSFLSYTRHEYFRRILCDIIGDLVENGEYPNDIEYLGKVVQDISYNNTIKYFNFNL